MAKKRRKSRIQGRDFDGWSWKFANGTFVYFAEPKRPKLVDNQPSDDGKWVRVKFVEVE